MEKTHRVFTRQKKRKVNSYAFACSYRPQHLHWPRFQELSVLNQNTQFKRVIHHSARNKHGTALKSLQALSSHEARYLSLPICEFIQSARLCSRNYLVCLPQPKNVMKVPKIDHTSLHLASRQKIIIDSRSTVQSIFSVLQLDSPWLLDCTLLKYQPLNLFLA